MQDVSDVTVSYERQEQMPGWCPVSGIECVKYEVRLPDSFKDPRGNRVWGRCMGATPDEPAVRREDAKGMGDVRQNARLHRALDQFVGRGAVLLVAFEQVRLPLDELSEGFTQHKQPSIHKTL